MPRRLSFGSRVGLSFAAIVAVLWLAGPLSAQATWPPVSPEELAMTDCSQQPGAPAIILYREEVLDHETLRMGIFKRLKILTAAGRDHANIEIPYLPDRQIVEGLEARVVPPKGSARPFTGRVFEKTAVRVRGFRVSVKSFALPDVEPGSIIDFRYKIVQDPGGSSGGSGASALEELLLARGKPEEGGSVKSSELLSFPAVNWEIQDKLFTVKAKFEFSGHPLIQTLFAGPCRLAWVSHKLEKAQPRIMGSRVELELENVPAFEEEEFMTSEEAERMSVEVFYLDQRIAENKDYWKRESGDWQKAAERFVGDPRKVAVEAEKLAGDATDPATRLKGIYEGVQKIRNLSYEKGLTRKQRKERKLKDNRKAAEVLERGYGLRSDITRTFVALARAAGFEAEVVRVSTRDDKLFRFQLLSFYEQMDSELALVNLGDKTMFFDPATPFCPFGLVHWSRSNTAALRFSDEPPAFFTTAVYPPDMALTRREVVLRLDAQGNLAGTLKTTYTGHEALVRRLEHMHDDDAARKEALEKELADILPVGAVGTLKKVESSDNSDPALIALYEISIPGFATAAGDKILLPVSPLAGSGQYPFRHAERKYPVYFPYPFREFDDVVITLPEGYSAEVSPGPRKTQDDFSAYSLVCAAESPQTLRVQRDLTIRKSLFPVGQYAALKSFYDAVRTSDGEQIILSAEKKQADDKK